MASSIPLLILFKSSMISSTVIVRGFWSSSRTPSRFYSKCLRGNLNFSSSTKVPSSLTPFSTGAGGLSNAKGYKKFSFQYTGLILGSIFDPS